MFSEWRAGEVAVLGMGRSGQAVTQLLRDHNVAVYLSDTSSEVDPSREAELRASGAEVASGGHDIDRIRRAAAVVVSPGIPPDVAVLSAARRAGVPIVSEVEVALQVIGNRSALVAVTGTNGKTTTTSLIGALVEAGGYATAVAGNIGLSLSQVARSEPPAVIVAELSSFQLHDTPSLAPTVGVVTNLSPDHLDRYPDVAAYYSDKELMFRNATEDSHWVLNGDDEAVMRLARPHPGQRSLFSVTSRADGWYDRDGGQLMLGDAVLIPREQLRLLGDHNVANALAAALAARAVGAALEPMRLALAAFEAPPHRLEPVGTYGGVLWINDSKATNVAATAVALAALDRPFVLLLGGRHKGDPYKPLAAGLKDCRLVVAYGESAELIVADLSGAITVERAGSFAEAVATAKQAAEPGDAVLLSPACSSFDMFANYQERGDAFRREAAR